MKPMKWTIIAVVVAIGMMSDATGADKKPSKPSSSQTKGRGFSSITGSTTWNVPKQENTDVAVCVQGAAFGTKGKVCVGTGGVTTGLSRGSVVTVGGSTTRGWDGKKTTCAGVSAGGGVKLYGTGGANVCNKDGKTVTQKYGGVGVGLGTDGHGGAAYVEFKKTTPVKTSSVNSKKNQR